MGANIAEFLTSVKEQVQEVSRAAYAAVVGDRTREKERAELKKVLDPILEYFEGLEVTDEIKEEALDYCMEHFMGRIEEEERNRAELEAKIQRGNEEIKEIKKKLEKKERQL